MELGNITLIEAPPKMQANACVFTLTNRSIFLVPKRIFMRAAKNADKKAPITPKIEICLLKFFISGIISGNITKYIPINTVNEQIYAVQDYFIPATLDKKTVKGIPKAIITEKIYKSTNFKEV